MTVSGAALYAAGRFNAAGGVPAKNIAKWNGDSWSEVGGGIGTGLPMVVGMTLHENALYVGGQFSQAGLVPTVNIAKWDGQAWHALGLGATGPQLSAAVYAAAGFQNALFAGGSFTHAGGHLAHHFAKWAEVNALPEIIAQPLDLESDVGESAQFSVASWGGDLSYQWHKNGIALTDGDNIVGSASSLLHIAHVGAKDAGAFDVVITSDCGEVTSQQAMLAVVCQFDIAPDGSANGEVDVDDLLSVINSWGQGGSPADFNNDGTVNEGDLSALIAVWGACP